MIRMENEINSVKWYHVLDLNGTRTPGIFDMSKYLDFYHMPESLVGKSGLDIGIASGFFAFEMEARGANPVVARDLTCWDDHDFSAQYRISDVKNAESEAMLGNAFDIAKKYKSSKVERKLINIYELGEQLGGKFDIVICANLLLHLQNPYLALENIRRVTSGVAIIATRVYEARFRKSRPILVYLNRPHVWYAPTPKCMELMSKQAGFSHCRYFGSYSQDPESGAWKEPVGVWHLQAETLQG